MSSKDRPCEQPAATNAIASVTPLSTDSTTAGVQVQHTLKSSIQCSGIGLHSGATVTLVLHPAPESSGIVFRRRRGLRPTHIPAHWSHVVDTSLCTVVGDGDGTTVGTVEHLMAALAGCAIDNAVIELDGPEVPAMDGSSAPFVFLIECAGRAAQKAPRRAIQVQTPVGVTGDGKSLDIAPAAELTIHMAIEFSESMIGRQDVSFRLEEGSFKSHLARARTFGFDHEVSAMRSAGLALGGSLDNAV
ncbi:MAG: UDP-3-O-acyl-N-acetylglucosamine deacetylase, partial [Alphaproteobacteria bacterium]